jgi:hypothetical protein
MNTAFRKILFAAVALVSVAGASLPASAQGWGGGWDRGYGEDRGGWGERHGGWHHRHGWDRPRCWLENRRVWVDTRWGPRERVSEVRICR